MKWSTGKEKMRKVELGIKRLEKDGSASHDTHMDFSGVAGGGARKILDSCGLADQNRYLHKNLCASHHHWRWAQSPIPPPQPVFFFPTSSNATQAAVMPHALCEVTCSSARLWNLPRLNEAKCHVGTGPRAKLRLSLGKVRGDGAARRIPCHPATLLRSHLGRIKNENSSQVCSVIYRTVIPCENGWSENILGHFCLRYCDLHHRSSDRIGNIVH